MSKADPWRSNRKRYVELKAKWSWQLAWLYVRSISGDPELKAEILNCRFKLMLLDEIRSKAISDGRWYDTEFLGEQWQQQAISSERSDL
jgi:hypothetical protein